MKLTVFLALTHISCTVSFSFIAGVWLHIHISCRMFVYADVSLLFSFLCLFWFRGLKMILASQELGKCSLFYFGKSMCKIRMNCSLIVWKTLCQIVRLSRFCVTFIGRIKNTQFLYWLRGPLMPFFLLASVLVSFYLSRYSFLLSNFSNICNRDARNIPLLSAV